MSKIRKKPAHYTYMPGSGAVTPVVCTDRVKDITITLHNIPIEALDFLDDWLGNLNRLNGGFGEMTFQVKGGAFSEASCTETFRFQKRKAQP